MDTQTGNLNQYWADLIIEELLRNGLEYICIAPGSRSTPLVLAAARHEKIKTLIGYDERSLGFHALGYARASGSPAAIITTSGTAVANLYPAVVEASTDGVPLIVLTADRPPELIDTGANQTIRQDRFFGDYVRWHFDLPCPDQSINPEMVLTTVDQAVFRSLTDLPGPVHLNCRYRQPLEPTDNPMPSGYDLNIQQWQKAQLPFTRYAMTKQIVPERELDALAGLIENTERGMIVAGQLTGPSMRTSVPACVFRPLRLIRFDITIRKC
jgi:2-succinyl-5-enolpyruvyl-6-hydroxy-3-cyclohexene-1-carboxylate synthase